MWISILTNLFAYKAAYNYFYGCYFIYYRAKIDILEHYYNWKNDRQLPYNNSAFELREKRMDLNELKELMKNVADYLYKADNRQLMIGGINERTICGCIKEVLDKKYENTGYNVDLEYNRYKHIEKDIEIDFNSNQDVKTQLENIIKEMNICIFGKKVADEYIAKYSAEYLRKVYNNVACSNYYELCEDFNYKKAFIPDIVIHRRNSDDNLIMIEVKKMNNSKHDFDVIKLSLIKKYTKLNYLYYVYVVADDKNQQISFYYLDNKEDNFDFEKLN